MCIFSLEHDRSQQALILQIGYGYYGHMIKEISIFISLLLLLFHCFQCSYVYGVTTTPTVKTPLNSSLRSNELGPKPVNGGVAQSFQANASSTNKIAAREDPLSIENIERALITGLITGLITFVALFGANYLLDIHRYRRSRPVLEIRSKENPSVPKKDIDLPIYDITKPDLPQDLRKISKFDLHYKVNRIKVRNNGNSAAEECKGLIIQNGEEMKVCWNIPSERHKLTINARSHEYLDLCGYLMDDAAELVKDLKKNVANLKENYTNSVNNSVILEDVRSLKFEFLEGYPQDTDNAKLIETYFPYIIAPTEIDWQHPPHRNWILKPGDAKVRVTSKNAMPIEYNIKILEKPENGMIVKVTGLVKERKISKLGRRAASTEHST
jgi:hypothetical protein